MRVFGHIYQEYKASTERNCYESPRDSFWDATLDMTDHIDSSLGFGRECVCFYIYNVEHMATRTVCTGHLEVRDHAEDIIHLIGPLLCLDDAVRGRIG